MQKSNWIIIAILVAALSSSCGCGRPCSSTSSTIPVDLVITLAWWLVIAGACVAIHLAEKKRRERIRTMFLAPGLVYNCETGVIRLEPGTSVVDTLQTLLGALNYSFDLAELPSNSRVRFQRIVRTSKFGDNGAIWEGELVEVAHPDRPQTFESRRELAILMGENV